MLKTKYAKAMNGTGWKESKILEEVELIVHGLTTIKSIKIIEEERKEPLRK